MATNDEGSPEKFHPTSVRLDMEHAEILKEILAAYSPPGVNLSFSDGVKIALVFWKENYVKAT